MLEDDISYEQGHLGRKIEGKDFSPIKRIELDYMVFQNYIKKIAL